MCADFLFLRRLIETQVRPVGTGVQMAAIAT
jgi:hypothetical protein